MILLILLADLARCGALLLSSSSCRIFLLSSSLARLVGLLTTSSSSSSYTLKRQSHEIFDLNFFS
jgi:hypothetical protein